MLALSELHATWGLDQRAYTRPFGGTKRERIFFFIFTSVGTALFLGKSYRKGR